MAKFLKIVRQEEYLVSEERGGSEEKDIWETARESGEFHTLMSAVKAAGLDKALKGRRHFTVLAPSDRAFSKLPQGTLQSLLSQKNRRKLKQIISYHVIPGDVLSQEAVRRHEAKTVEGEEVCFNTEKNQVMVENAHMIKADIHCKNGIIHEIDSVLMPKMVISTRRHHH